MLPIPPFSWFNRWVISMVGQWWVACHQRSGAVKAAAISAPASEPAVGELPAPAAGHDPHRQGHGEQADVVLVGQPEPEDDAGGNPQPRVTGPTDAHDEEGQGGPEEHVEAGGSEEVVGSEQCRDGGRTQGTEELGRPLPTELAGQEPARTTVPAPASADHSRSPGSETPNAHRESRAKSGVRTGWST